MAAYRRSSESDSTDWSWVTSWSLLQIISYHIVDRNAVYCCFVKTLSRPTHRHSSGARGSRWSFGSRLSLQTFHTLSSISNRAAWNLHISLIVHHKEDTNYTFSPLGPADPSGPTGPGAPWSQKINQVAHQSFLMATSNAKSVNSPLSTSCGMSEISLNASSLFFAKSQSLCRESFKIIWLTLAPSFPGVPSDPFSPTVPCCKEKQLFTVVGRRQYTRQQSV